jgi:tetratricopeptide (TPR) repeat protein
VTTINISDALSTALEHHRAGRFDLAKDIYVQILKANENHIDALNLLGQILFEWQHYEASAALTARAAALLPGAAALHVNLAAAQEILGNVPAAAAALGRGLSLDPCHGQGLGLYAAVSKEQGRLAQAMAAYDRLSRLSPADSFPEEARRLCAALLDGTAARPDGPPVTVVIPCYNYGQYVAEAVDSALGQTYPNLDVVVVDGGSGADTLAALGDLQRPRTRIFLRDGRHLVGSNRNFGIAATTSPYICCLDADDALEPTYIEKAVFYLETVGYDVVAAQVQCFGDKTNRLRWPLTRKPTLDQLLTFNQVPSSAVFRRSGWEKAGGFHDFGIGPDYVYEDWNFWVRLAALGARFLNMDERLFRYRTHGAPRLTSQSGLKSLAEQRPIIHAFNRDVLGQAPAQTQATLSSEPPAGGR